MAQRNFIDVLVRILDAARFERDAKREASAVRDIGRAAETTGTQAKLSVKSLKQLGAFVGVQYAAHRAVSAFSAAASDLNEQTNKTQVVFGSASAAVLKFAGGSASALGQSQVQALAALSTYGNLFRALGIGEQASAKMSMRLDQLAADLASFNNASPQDALDAIRAGLVGETEPLRRFGVNLQDATLRQQAMAMGLTNTTKNVLTPHQRALAAYALILQQTTLAQGDFARTSGGLANQQRKLSAEWDNAQATLGTAMIPAFLALVEAANRFLDVAGPVLKNTTAMRILILSLAVGWGLYTVATIAATLATLEISAVMAVSVIGAVILLSAVIVLLVSHWSDIRAVLVVVGTYLRRTFGPTFMWTGRLLTRMGDTAKDVFNWIRGHWQLLAAIMGGPIVAAVILIVEHFNTLKAKVLAVWHAIAGAIEGAVKRIRDAVGTVKTILGYATGVTPVLKGVRFAGSVVGAANGGIVSSGGTVMVGERGPELVYLPRSAQVHPLDRSAGGAGRQVNVTIQPQSISLDGRELTRVVWKHTNDQAARR